MRQGHGNVWWRGVVLLALGCGGGIDSGYSTDIGSDDADPGDWIGDDGDVPADRGEDGDGATEDGGRVCGDGVRHLPEEECDDGSGNSDTRRDACRTDCRRW